SRTTPTNRMPLRAAVRMRRCCSPLSPMARRAALMRLARVESDTMRPSHTPAIKSSLLTTRSRLRIRKTMRAKTCRSTRSKRAFATQLAPVGINNIVLEEEQQVAAPARPHRHGANFTAFCAQPKIKTSSRINQARLKDPSPARPTSSTGENRASIRAAMQRSYRTQKQFVRLPNQENDDGTDHWIFVWTRGLCRIPRNVPLRHRLRFRRGGAQDHR